MTAAPRGKLKHCVTDVRTEGWIVSAVGGVGDGGVRGGRILVLL